MKALLKRLWDALRPAAQEIKTDDLIILAEIYICRDLISNFGHEMALDDLLSRLQQRGLISTNIAEKIRHNQINTRNGGDPNGIIQEEEKEE